MWKAMLCTKEYNLYIKPNTQDVLAEAKTDVRTVSVNELIKSMDLVTKAEELGQQQDMTANGGRRSRFKRKTEKRRRSLRK